MTHYITYFMIDLMDYYMTHVMAYFVTYSMSSFTTLFYHILHDFIHYSGSTAFKEKAVRGDRPGGIVRRKSFTGFGPEGAPKSTKVRECH
jgi:hypothetical protein